MLDDIDQIMESVNQEAANDTAEMETSAVEKTAEQKEDTAEVKMMRVPVKMELMIWQSMISELMILDWMIRKQKTKKAVSDEDDELMKILSGTGEDSEIPEADNAKAEVRPDDGGKKKRSRRNRDFWQSCLNYCSVMMNQMRKKFPECRLNLQLLRCLWMIWTS